MKQIVNELFFASITLVGIACAYNFIHNLFLLTSDDWLLNHSINSLFSINDQFFFFLIEISFYQLSCYIK